jgi:hypothetical protein
VAGGKHGREHPGDDGHSREHDKHGHGEREDDPSHSSARVRITAGNTPSGRPSAAPLEFRADGQPVLLTGTFDKPLAYDTTARRTDG